MLNFMRLKGILENPAIPAGLEQYRFLMDRLRETDVTSDREYQRTFREFYHLRGYYSEVFVWRYFALLEELKTGPRPDFETVFHRVLGLQGSYELSFSSKLAHTLSPRLPIWDSMVAMRHFGFKAPSVRRDREAACCRRYQEYEARYNAYMGTPDGRTLLRFFDDKFPDNGISDVKKLDFILSLDR